MKGQLANSGSPGKSPLNGVCVLIQTRYKGFFLERSHGPFLGLPHYTKPL